MSEERAAVRTTEPPGQTNKWLALSTVSLGAFMSTLNSSIVAISLPVMARNLGVGISEIEWVVVAYLLATGALLLAFGRLGDIFGYKKVYIGGFALFTVAGTLCGAAQGIWDLTALRVLQGIGSGMVLAIGPAIIASTFAPSERGKALGFNAISVSLGLTLGPTLGGLVAEGLSWRWIFLINLPIGLFGVLWAWRILSEARRGSGQRFDFAGAALIAVSLTCLLLALVEGENWGWGSARIVGLFAAFALPAVAFVITELRIRQPMYDLRLFGIWSYSTGNVSLLVMFVVLFAVTFLMPFFLQRGQGYSVLDAGLLITPLSLTTLFVAPLSGSLSDRIGTRLLSTAGLLLTALGLLSLTQLNVDSGARDIVWRLAVIGVGQGLFNSPNNSAILGSVPKPRLGIASGTVAQMRVTGQALGIALSGAILAGRIPEHARKLAGSVPRSLVGRDALILSIHDAFYVAAAICVIGILTSFFTSRRKVTAEEANF